MQEIFQELVSEDSRTRVGESIAIVSGKGGTGKTFLASCLAFALQNAGLKVCLVDTDFGTQGLSLFILGGGGQRGISAIHEENSLYHKVSSWGSRTVLPVPMIADRRDDHELETPYNLIVSNQNLYDRRLVLGRTEEAQTALQLQSEIVGEGSEQFRRDYENVVSQLLFELTHTPIDKGGFDYVIVDTRGGFEGLSIVPAVYSDSFIVVTEADFTSLNQLSKLLTNIDLMSTQRNSSPVTQYKTSPLVRGALVNKAINDEETNFRLALFTSFGIEQGQSWAIPLDTNAIRAYKRRLIPYVSSPDTPFSGHSLAAFNEMFDLVTAEWELSVKDSWRRLLSEVNEATRLKERETETKKRRQIEASNIKTRALEDSLSQVSLLEGRAQQLQNQIDDTQDRLLRAEQDAGEGRKRNNALEERLMSERDRIAELDKRTAEIASDAQLRLIEFERTAADSRDRINKLDEQLEESSRFISDFKLEESARNEDIESMKEQIVHGRDRQRALWAVILAFILINIGIVSSLIVWAIASAAT